MIFKNRADAGERLASRLTKFQGLNTVVLAIPRGGVVIGAIMADRLACPLDIVVPRKIGAPLQPELAVGAVSEDGSVYLEEQFVSSLGISASYIQQESAKQVSEIRRRMRLYKGGSDREPIRGKTVILTDDGIATGATMKAAIISSKKEGPEKMVVAVPVASPRTISELKEMVDEVISLLAPDWMSAIGEFYEDFGQVSDEEVISTIRGVSKNIRGDAKQ